jgi:predicted methyltransferase
MKRLCWIALAGAAILATGCKKAETPTTAEAPAPAAEAPATTAAPAADTAAIAAALASTERLPGDSDEDARRKAAQVLEFLEVSPGERVLDFFAAGGYYSELLSRIVGPNGQVTAYNNAQYLKFSGEKPAQRYGNDRLANVAQLTTPPEDMPLEPATLDAALFVQSYHDLYWRTKDGSWPPTDPAKTLAKLVPALKPGAVVVVVDHVAASGSDPLQTVDALHRIDPAVIRRDFEAAGLVFDAESDIFRNPQDDHTKPVFDESIRHRTDQVMYRFRKPAGG